MKEARTKVVLALFLVSAIVVLALSLYTGIVMNSLTESLDQCRGERMVAEAASASLVVSEQELSAVVQTSDMQDENYTQLSRRLAAFSVLHNVKEVFYLRPTLDGNLQYIISSTDQHNLNTEPIAANSLTDSVLEKGAIAVVGQDEYKSALNSDGQLLAYAPVFDQSGRVIAIAGVGIADDILVFVDGQTKNLSIILLACIAVVIIAACANVLLQVRKENELQERVNQQNLMVDISHTLISEQEFKTSVVKVLEAMTTFLGSQRAYLLDTLDGKQTPELRYLWQNDDTRPRDIKAEIDLVIKRISNQFEQTADASVPYHVTLCDNTAKAEDGIYQQLSDVGINSFAWAPLYVENHLWGVLLIDYIGQTHRWTNSERQLISGTANDLAGAIARERVNEQREQALDHAVQASEAKSEFLSNMSHEMRTPMNAIIGMTTIALGSNDPDRKDYCLNHIQDASANLLSIINDVLDMSSLQSYSLELVCKPFSLGEAIKEVADDVAHKIKEHSQAFNIRIDTAVPDVLIGDKKRLNQVIKNLLSNANKFTPDGGTIDLEVLDKGTDVDGHWIYFAVIDNGIGISPTLQKNLFTSFEQADSGSSRRYGGAGLGLAISRRIVELMGGHIGLESEPDKGSTFHFSINLPEGRKEDLITAAQPRGDSKKTTVEVAAEPLAAADDNTNTNTNTNTAPQSPVAEQQSQPKFASAESAAPAASAAAAASATAAATDNQDTTATNIEDQDLSNYHILLAEDIDINREVVFALLESSGIKIDVATNGIEALQAISSNIDSYDLVFMDLQMPEMDGLDATRRIRSLPEPKAKTLPIIAMTANVFQEDIEQCLKAGMNDHIGKPINLKGIYSILGEYLPKK